MAGAFAFGLEVLEVALGAAFLTGALGLDALEGALPFLEPLEESFQSGVTPYALWTAARCLRSLRDASSPSSEMYPRMFGIGSNVAS